MVCPKLSSIRGPRSRGSSSTTRIFQRTQRSITSRNAVRSIASGGRFQGLEEGGVEDGRRLDHLGPAVVQLPRGQALQQGHVDHRQAGRVEGPPRFLPRGRLTAVLPPTELSTCASTVVGTCTRDTRAQVRGGDEPRPVPDYPPAEGHDRIPALRLLVGQPGERSPRLRQRLGPSPPCTADSAGR